MLRELMTTLAIVPLCACVGGDDSTTKDSGNDQTAPTDSGPDSTPVDAGKDNTTSDAPADSPTDAPPTCNADAGEVLCGSTCAILASNASHCGACNHDCLGGTCSASMCQPITLATLTHDAYRLATDGTFVVFTVNAASASGGGVYSVSVTGTNQTPTTIHAQDYAGAVAMHGTSVYWVASNGNGFNTIMTGTAGQNGATDSTSTLGTASAWAVEGITLNSGGTTLAYLMFNSSAKLAQVGSCPTSNLTSCSSTGTGVTELYAPSGPTTDDTSIFWSDVTAGRIQKTPLAIGTVTNFVSNAQATPGHIIYDSNYVYWSGDGSGTLLRSPVQSPAQATVASVNSPNGMAVDAKYVYISNGGSTVDYVAVGGGTASALAPASQVREMTRDSKALYYYNGSDLTLRKVALPL